MCIYESLRTKGELNRARAEGRPPIRQQQRILIDPTNRARLVEYLNAIPADSNNLQLVYLQRMLRAGYSIEDVHAAIEEMEEAEIDGFLPNLSRFGQR